MNAKKTLIGGIAGGVAILLMDWLIYLILLAKYMASSGNQCVARPEGQMIWWSLILGDLAWGFILMIIINWSNAAGWKACAQKGAIFGLLVALASDLFSYAVTTRFSGLVPVIVDIAAFAVMTAIAGAVIGLVVKALK